MLYEYAFVGGRPPDPTSRVAKEADVRKQRAALRDIENMKEFAELHGHYGLELKPDSPLD